MWGKGNLNAQDSPIWGRKTHLAECPLYTESGRSEQLIRVNQISLPLNQGALVSLILSSSPAQHNPETLD